MSGLSDAQGGMHSDSHVLLARDAPALTPHPSATQLAAWVRLWDYLLRPLETKAGEPQDATPGR
jgi:hypothetical protein